MRVYLADRDEVYRTKLAHALRALGNEVVEFASGRELYARTLEDEPDLLVMDTELEGADGFQVFVWLRRKRPGRPYPIVLLTRREHPGIALVCKHLGALDYLAKPASVGPVARRIEELLAERESLPESDPKRALDRLLQQGRSGRLEILACGERGYIHLYRGKLLEAKWSSFEGDDAVRVLTQVPLGTRFRFVEWPEQGVPSNARRLPATPGHTDGDSGASDLRRSGAA